MRFIKKLRAVLRESGGERGVVLVTSLLVMLVLLPLGAVFLSVSLTETTVASNEVAAAQGLMIAEAGIEHARRQLPGIDTDALLLAGGSLFSNEAFGGGSYSVTVSNNMPPVFPKGSIPADNGSVTSDNDGYLVVTSTGTSGNSSRTIEVVVQPLVPPGLRGGVTANGPVATAGQMIIDGRDHDMDGNLIANNGTYGVSTASTYTQGTNDTVGGTTPKGKDRAPRNPANPTIIDENTTEPLPATPDEVAGVSEGTLKAIAMSGVNGSQYVTDPALLTWPLSGVTYVEIPPDPDPENRTWTVGSSGALNGGTGILVVHNSATNAIIKNINETGVGCDCFKGLFIADDIIHIHSKIIGAVVSLTPLPSAGNVIGNGSGSLLYSRQVLSQLPVETGGAWPIVSWRELN